jgi:hypothetical protein
MHLITASLNEIALSLICLRNVFVCQLFVFLLVPVWTLLEIKNYGTRIMPTLGLLSEHFNCVFEGF